MPKAFQSIAIELPLIIEALHHVETASTTAGKAPSKATIAALRPVVEGCRTQVKELDQILQKLKPSSDDRWWGKGKKIVFSLGQEKAVQRIQTSLHSCIDVLTLHRIVSYQTQ